MVGGFLHLACKAFARLDGRCPPFSYVAAHARRTRDAPADTAQCTMLNRIIYISECQCDGAEVARILKQSRESNARRDITGALYLADGTFLQYVEGMEDEITALYRRIERDPRHAHCRLLDHRAISGRVFKGWSMAWLGQVSEAHMILRTILAQTDVDAGIDGPAAGAFFYAMAQAPKI
jgi:hypothetical protein